MLRRKNLTLLGLLVILAMLFVACGGDADPTEAPVAQPTDEPVDEPVDEPTEEPMDEPTEEPMDEPTEEPMDEPTEEADAGDGETAAGDIDCMGAQSGDEVTMLYQWSGVEEENLNRILQPLIDACGIVLAPEASRDQALLDTRVQAGTPPDITFFNVTQLEQYSEQLIPVTELGVHEENYADFWREIGTVDGEWLGVPVKVDIKTIIWYSPINFEAFGYEVPETWADLEALVEQMVADGNVPWSMGFESGDATGWTGSDFIQDILLVTQGPDYVNGLVSGEIPYDDAGVQEAYEIYGQWAADEAYTVGGLNGTLSTGFVNAIYQVFEDPPQAMMVKQSGFAGGEIQAQFPELEYGTDFAFFGVPDAQGVQGGSDWMMAFSDEPAVQAVFAYLTSETGARRWAEVGFDLTPNSSAGDAYTDPSLQSRADILAEAQGFTPDIGDSIPGGFGSAEWGAIISYLSGDDIAAALAEPAQIQQDQTAE